MRESEKKLFARHLRARPTDAERLLWIRLRRRQMVGRRFRRQVPLGTYIVDFACIDAHLVIEVDGSQHLECASDAARDRWLHENGFRVLRFWNHDVLERTDEVLAQILQALSHDGPHPASGHLPPQAGEGKKQFGLSPHAGEGEERQAREGKELRPSWLP